MIAVYLRDRLCPVPGIRPITKTFSVSTPLAGGDILQLTRSIIVRGPLVPDSVQILVEGKQ